MLFLKLLALFLSKFLCLNYRDKIFVIHVFVGAYLLLTYLPAYPPTYLPTYPTYLPNLPTYLPTYLSPNVPINHKNSNGSCVIK